MKRLYVIMLVILVNITALAQQIEPVQFNTLEYWWDGNVEQSEKVTLQSYSEKDNIAFDIDASALSKGMHVLYYKISDNNHNWSPVYVAWIEAKDKSAKEIQTLKYWWGTSTDKAQNVEISKGTTIKLDQWFVVPEYAKQDAMTEKGMARFCYSFMDDMGRMSAPEYIDVIYSKGPELSYKNYDYDIELSWTYSDKKGVKDYNVYCSEDDGPYVLLKAATTQTTFSMKKTAAEKYKFLVTARNNSNQSTSFSDEWSVTYDSKSK